MRLLLVTTEFPPDIGGTQTYAFELARRLAPLVEKFAVVSLCRPGSEEIDRTLPFRVHRVDASYNTFCLKSRSLIAQLGRSGEFDRIFCISWPSALSCALARKTGGPAKIVCAAHGRELLYNPWSHNRLAHRIHIWTRSYTLRNVDRFLAVSNFTADIVRSKGISEDRIRVLNNGTDPSKFYPMDVNGLREQLRIGDRRAILTVGRLVHRKGLDTMISAMPDVLENVPDAVYLIGGSGPDRDRLEEHADKVGVRDHVRFLGTIPYHELNSYYNVCDVFVLAARETETDVEGYGIVLLEAGACAKPVVGTSAGGIPDAVLDDDTGLIVSPDSPDELGRAVTRILTDDLLARRLGHAGRERVRTSANWDAVAEKLVIHLSEV